MKWVCFHSHLVFKHWRVLRHKVDIDIPGPVANHHHQAQDEEEYEEVRGLGVGAIQQTQHGHQQDDTQANVKISKEYSLFIV